MLPDSPTFQAGRGTQAGAAQVESRPRFQPEFKRSGSPGLRFLKPPEPSRSSRTSPIPAEFPVDA